MWGLESLSYAEAAKRVKAAGYDGMEIAARDKNYQEVWKAVRDNGLELVLMAFGGSATFAEHKPKFRDDLLELAAQKPLFINSHTGKDFFTYEQNAELIQVAAEVQKQTGVKILHETHRGRFSYSAPAIQYYIQNIPDLRLTGDFSHWVNVAESYLTDQVGNMTRAMERTDHIHCHVGQPEAPQVSDPRAPGYLPTLPYTNQPVVSQWDINKFMMDYLKKRWA